MQTEVANETIIAAKGEFVAAPKDVLHPFGARTAGEHLCIDDSNTLSEPDVIAVAGDVTNSPYTNVTDLSPKKSCLRVSGAQPVADAGAGNGMVQDPNLYGVHYMPDSPMMPRAKALTAGQQRRLSISQVPSPFARALPDHLEGAGEPFEEASHSPRRRRPSRRATESAEHQCVQSLKGYSSSLAPREKWILAIKAVQTVGGVAKQFHTLRDMQSSSEVPRQAIKVVSVLGKGAFAIVEKCIYRPAGGKPAYVAVKRLKPELTRNDADIRDMVQEIALLRKLANRYIVNFLGYGHWEFTTTAQTTQGSLFIVEELVDGGSLKTIVSKQMRDAHAGHYRSVDALRWLRQMALGLAYLHRSQPQVIHRDLKLDNILIKGANLYTCEAKIADFGLSALVRRTSAFANLQEEIHSPLKQPARARRASATDLDNVWSQAAQLRQSATGAQHKPQLQPRPSANPQNSPQLTVATGYDQLSGRTGTLMYMAPEVYRQEQYDEKADVYSYSIIAYELLHRYTMISATDGSLEECQAYARRVARGFRPPITAKMPPQLTSLLQRCWHQDATQRPSMELIANRIAHLEATLGAELNAFDATFGSGIGSPTTSRCRTDTPPVCCTIS